MFLKLLDKLKYQVVWSRFSSIESNERVEMDIGVLVIYRLIQGNTHGAARVNGIYPDDIIYLLIETLLFI